MKKTFIYGFIMALCAVAFASCTTDETLDSAKVALSGKTKTLTVVPAIDQTRTTLTPDHKLLWVENDTFGILAAQGTTVLENIKSPAYDPEKESDEYVIEVPEETDRIYCYYPYDAGNDALAQGDISAFTFTLPNLLNNETAGEKYQGEFLPQYHFMVAQSEVRNESLVFAKFAPVVTVVEFNIYDTEGDADTIEGLIFTGDDYIAGTFTPDFASGELSHTGSDKEKDTRYVSLQIAGENSPAVGKEKGEGAKLYLTVPAAEYKEASVMIATAKYDTSSGYFDALEWENGINLASAYGKTVNLNLVHAKPAPLVKTPVLTQVDGNPFFATATVKVDPYCDFLAVRVVSSSSYESQKNSFDGFVDELYNAYMAYKNNGDESKLNNLYNEPFYPFLGYFDDSADVPVPQKDATLTISEWQMLYNGSWNYVTKAFDKPGHTKESVLQPEQNYTLVMYASSYHNGKYPDGMYVYESEFRTPAMEFNGTGTITIGDYVQTGGKAAVKITASNIKKIVWWVVKPNDTQLKNTSALSPDDLLEALTTFVSTKDSYFRDYTGEISLEQPNMDPGQKYYFCAAGVDNDGKLVAGNVIEAQAADVEFNSEKYAITNVELASQPTGLGSSELTFTFENGQAPAYLRIYSAMASNVDGAAATEDSDEREALSWEYLQNTLRSTSSTAADYAAVKVEGNEVTYAVRLPGDEKKSVDSSGSEDVVTDSTGDNPFYILVVGADNEGDLATELGAIYQVTGKYNEPKLTKLEDDIIRGVAVGDKTHTRINEDAYYYSCPSDEFAEKQEEEKNTGIWADSSAGVQFNYTSFGATLWAYSTGATGKGWIFKLGSLEKYGFSGGNLPPTYPVVDATFLANIKVDINKLFADYAETGTYSSTDAKLMHEEKAWPTSNTNGGTYTVANCPWWTDNLEAYYVYIFVYETEDNKLAGKAGFTTEQSNWNYGVGWTAIANNIADAFNGIQTW